MKYLKKNSVVKEYKKKVTKIETEKKGKLKESMNQIQGKITLAIGECISTS